jgi:hypothetical protein
MRAHQSLVPSESDTMTDPAAKPAPIAWDSYRRWFLYGRIFRIAIQSRLLALAFVGVLLTLFGWWGLAEIFSGTDEPAVKRLLEEYKDCPWKNAGRGGDPFELMMATLQADGAGPNLGHPPRDALFDPWNRLSTPFRQFFEASRTIVGAAFLLLCCIWTAVVWGLFGGAITRSVVMQLTREEAPSLSTASRFALKRWKSLASAPLFPVFAVALMAVPAVFVGLLMKAWLLIGAVLWPLMLLFGLIAAILLVGLSIGWPLMHAAIGAEGSDGFDALSRSYSYVYQRPLHYLFYALSAFLLGIIGLAVVGLFSGAVEGLALWGVSWGSGAERAAEAAAASIGAATQESWGAKLFWFWHGVVQLIVLAFAFAFFWTASSAIYLLLRHDVDGIEVGEVFLDDSGTTYVLPPVTTDAAGVKVAATEIS